MPDAATPFSRDQLLFRLRAAGLHLAAGLLLVSVVTATVLHLWFPGELRDIAGGWNLILLMIGVDAALGPLLTFFVFDRRKAWPVLRRDLACIAVVQVAALLYGGHAATLARPVVIVFEVDRFRVVTAAEVLESELPQAKPPYRVLPWNGPLLLGTRDSTQQESASAIDLALQGYDRGQRPTFWQDYRLSQPDILRHSRPLPEWLAANPRQQQVVQRRLTEIGLSAADARYLPAQSRTSEGLCLVTAAGDFRGLVSLAAGSPA